MLLLAAAALASPLDVAHLDLHVDLRDGSARAAIRLEDRVEEAVLEVGGLRIREVEGVAGWTVADGRLRVRGAETFTVVYQLGAVARVPWTLTWPDGCGRLFPCNPDPSDGLTFALRVTPPEGSVAVHAERVEVEVPAYLVAWAVGPYTPVTVGRTGQGREVVAWLTDPGDGPAAAAGLAPVLRAADWLETTLGPYPFGDRLGAVAVSYDRPELRGMEHHPYWHVTRDALGEQGTQVHELVHAWFGNSVRIACWEDLVLSEGVTEYLTAAVVGATGGDEAAVWARHQAPTRGVGWGTTCGATRPDPYDAMVRGARFLRALEREVGREALLRAIGTFWRANRGRAAKFEDLLAVVQAETGHDPRPLAERMLR